MAICRALKIPKSTFYMLKKELYKENLQYYLQKRRSKVFDPLSSTQKEYISKIVKPPTSSETIRSIQDRIKHDLGEQVKPNWIKQFMKSGIRYSYKRGSNRNLRAQDPDSIYMKAIFSWNLFNDIRDGNLIINIDESSFSRSVKSNYFWLPINKSSGIVNVDAQGRTTMIWGLLSSGDRIWLMVDDTVNSQDFWVFLYILKIFLDSNYQNLWAKITLLLDNASIHLTNEVKRVATKYGIRILGLPPYWLHLAPVEFVFGLVKGSIKNSSKNQGIDFSRSSGKRAIINGLEYLTREKVIKCGGKSFRLLEK